MPWLIRQAALAIFLVSAVVSVVPSASAGEGEQKLFELNDGSYIAGEVIDETDTAYLVRMASGDTVRIAYDEIKRVQVLSEDGADDAPDGPGSAAQVEENETDEFTRYRTPERFRLPAENIDNATKYVKKATPAIMGWGMNGAGALFSIVGVAVASDDSRFWWTHVVAICFYGIGWTALEIKASVAHSAYRALGMTDDSQGATYAGNVLSGAGFLFGLAAAIVHGAGGGIYTVPVVVASVSLMITASIFFEADRAKYVYKTNNIIETAEVADSRPLIRIAPMAYVSPESGAVHLGVAGVF